MPGVFFDGSLFLFFAGVKRVGKGEGGHLVVARDGCGLCTVEEQAVSLRYYHTWPNIKAFAGGGKDGKDERVGFD